VYCGKGGPRPSTTFVYILRRGKSSAGTGCRGEGVQRGGRGVQRGGGCSAQLPQLPARGAAPTRSKRCGGGAERGAAEAPAGPASRADPSRAEGRRRGGGRAGASMRPGPGPIGRATERPSARRPSPLAALRAHIRRGTAARDEVDCLLYSVCMCVRRRV